MENFEDVSISFLDLLVVDNVLYLQRSSFNYILV